jgi:hypothetical protein
VLIKQKIMGWTGLEANLQQWESKFIKFLQKLLKKKIIEDLCIGENDLKWALEKWGMEDFTEFDGSEKRTIARCCENN